ncbi:MAG: response regulator [bacterium]|nr:response regulator [bacterium]
MKTIAIVDEFKSNTKIFSSLLQNSGYNIVESNLPSDAIKEFDRKKIDLLVCNYKMSEMTGAELIKTIKSKYKYKNLPALILSTEQGIEARANAIEAGALNWIRKPFDKKRLLKVVDNLLK